MASKYQFVQPGGLLPGADPDQIVRRYEKMDTRIFEDEGAGADFVAREIAQCIRSKQALGERCVLGLTTGSSPRGIYRRLAMMHREEGLSFPKVSVFVLDEFIGIASKDVRSRYRVVADHLLDRVDIDVENIHFLRGDVSLDEASQNAEQYEKEIVRAGGIDLMLLGMGVQGQIGFNEPGAFENTSTRLVALSHASRMAVSSLFQGTGRIPDKALTMGLSTIMKARRVILVAWGEEKAKVIRQVVEESSCPTVPASVLQKHPSVNVVVDSGAAQCLTRVETPWLVGRCRWTPRFVRKAVLWLCRCTQKPILKLTREDYLDHSLGEMLEDIREDYDQVNIKVFNDLQHTISGWPGGKPGVDDSTRPERKSPFPKRVLIFSPHPDDDVISMGGTFLRLVTQGHDVHVAYQTSGNIAVEDDVVLQMVDTLGQIGWADCYEQVKKIISDKDPSATQPAELLQIKGAIRRGEARAACRSFGLDVQTHVHFLDMPFYETGGVKKGELTQRDIDILIDILRQIKPHQIYAAGDLSDPHGTHRVCIEALLEALEQIQDDSWLKQCRMWLYRGAWQEWDIDRVDMAVPLSPDEVVRKRHAIYRHLSQKDIVPFPGQDKREFWQRAEERTQCTAAQYDRLGMAEYEAMEVFVRLF